MTGPLSAGLAGSGPAAPICQPVRGRWLRELLTASPPPGPVERDEEGVAAPGRGRWGHSIEASKGRGLERGCALSMRRSAPHLPHMVFFS